MRLTRNLFLLAALAVAPAIAVAAPAGTGGGVSTVTPGMGAGPTGGARPLEAPYGTNAVPGGVTLVPGTVVTPGVSGSSVTGTVPLAGTVGSAGVGNLNPGLAPSGPRNPNSLYAPIQPQSALPSANQSVLPQTIPGSNGR
jgi:hypothetical protein